MTHVVARYERTEYAGKYLDESGVIEHYQSGGVTREGVLMLTVGILICDDYGSFGEDELMVAMCDQSIVNAADQVLKKAGL